MFMHVMVMKFLHNEADAGLGAVARKGLLNWSTSFMIEIYNPEQVLETKVTKKRKVHWLLSIIEN